MPQTILTPHDMADPLVSPPICKPLDPPLSLSDIDPNNKEGYLSFLRLVGTAYFLKYRGTYQGTKSPVHLFHSCKSTSSLEQHITWLNKIREHVWVHTYEEKNLLPSHTALKFQWLRALWVVHMWAQAGS